MSAMTSVARSARTHRFGFGAGLFDHRAGMIDEGNGESALEEFEPPFAGAAAKVGTASVGITRKVRLDVPPGQLIVEFPIGIVIDRVILRATRS